MYEDKFNNKIEINRESIADAIVKNINLYSHDGYEYDMIKFYIGMVIDDFESRTCENCKHYAIDNCCELIDDWDCYYDSPSQWSPPKDFGCNKFERK